MEESYRVIEAKSSVPKVVLPGMIYFGSLGNNIVNKRMTREQFLKMVEIDELLQKLGESNPEYFEVNRLKHEPNKPILLTEEVETAYKLLIDRL